MPSFELNRMQSITGIGPVSGTERAKAKPAPEGGAAGLSTPVQGGSGSGSSSAAGVAVEVSAPVQSGPPIDTDRVAEIRSALRDGTYPLVPTKIADAMIAAQYNFESEE